jgi:hypothetical protein
VRALSNIAANDLPFNLAQALAASAEGMTYRDRAALRWRVILSVNRILGLYVAGGWSEATAVTEAALTEYLDDQNTPVFQVVRQWIEEACGLPPTAQSIEEAPDELWLAWHWQQRLIAARRAADLAAIREASAMCLRDAYRYGGLGDDYPIFWPVCVLASLEAGALDQAAEQVAFVDDAPPGQIAPLLRAQLVRMQGMLALHRGEDPEQLLRQGIDALDAFGAVPDAARARHALGSWLVGQHRAEEAQPLLAAARAVYEELGTAAWLVELGSLGAELHAA